MARLSSLLVLFLMVVATAAQPTTAPPKGKGKAKVSDPQVVGKPGSRTAIISECFVGGKESKSKECTELKKTEAATFAKVKASLKEDKMTTAEILAAELKQGDDEDGPKGGKAKAKGTGTSLAEVASRSIRKGTATLLQLQAALRARTHDPIITRNNAAKTAHQFPWANAQVPYFVEGPQYLKDRVTEAVASWQASTCVKFVQLKAKPKSSPAAIFQESEQDRCASFVGMKDNAVNIITLSRKKKRGEKRKWPEGCPAKNIVHEIGHALGLSHSHQRRDQATFMTLFPKVSGNHNYQIRNQPQYEDGVIPGRDGNQKLDNLFSGTMMYPTSDPKICPGPDCRMTIKPREDLARLKKPNLKGAALTKYAAKEAERRRELISRPMVVPEIETSIINTFYKCYPGLTEVICTPGGRFKRKRTKRMRVSEMWTQAVLIDSAKRLCGQRFMAPGKYKMFYGKTAAVDLSNDAKVLPKIPAFKHDRSLIVKRAAAPGKGKAKGKATGPKANGSIKRRARKILAK